MENNENNYLEKDENKSCDCKCKCCKKFFMVAFCAFIGSFLAFYVLMHQTLLYHKHSMHHHFINHERQMLHHFEKDFHEAEHIRGNEFNNFQNKISAIQTLKYEDAYIICINLKPFNNNEKNIRFNINGNVVTVSGEIVKNKQHSENSYYFTESFEIPEKIKMDDIQKEKFKDKYIITIPVEN